MRNANSFIQASKFATSSPIFSDIVPWHMTIIIRHKKVFIFGGTFVSFQVSQPGYCHLLFFEHKFYSLFSYNALFFKAQYSDLFPLNNIIQNKNQGVIFYVIISAFGFAIVCCRYNDDNTRIYLGKMTNHLCWRVRTKKMSAGS